MTTDNRYIEEIESTTPDLKQAAYYPASSGGRDRTRWKYMDSFGILHEAASLEEIEDLISQQIPVVGFSDVFVAVETQEQLKYIVESESTCVARVFITSPVTAPASLSIRRSIDIYGGPNL